MISKNPNTISLGENHNIQLAPSLLISYQNEDGETLAPDKLIWNYGENNEKVFERGKNYIIKPIKHTNLPNTADRSIYLTPQYQRAYFVDGVEYPRIIFIYETPKLLFHYDFNEEDDAKINLLRDMSEPSLHNPINHGTSYGAPTREGR